MPGKDPHPEEHSDQTKRSPEAHEKRSDENEELPAPTDRVMHAPAVSPTTLPTVVTPEDAAFSAGKVPPISKAKWIPLELTSERIIELPDRPGDQVYLQTPQIICRCAVTTNTPRRRNHY